MKKTSLTRDRNLLIWNSNHAMRLIGTATAGLESSKKVCMARRALCSFTIGCLSCGLKPSVFKQDSVGINIGSGAWPAPNFVVD